MSARFRSSPRSNKQLSGGCAALFGLPFIIAGLAIGWFLYFPVISTWWSARGWEEVPCWIEKAEMKTSRGSKGGTTHKVEASYRYQYRGRTYHSDEVALTGGSDNIGDFQERANAQIRAFVGKDRPFRCYVNPAKPEQAVLFRDLRWGLMLLMSIFPMVFPLAGFTVAIGGWLQSRDVSLSKQLSAQHPGEPWRWQREWAGDAIIASKDGLPFILGIAGWFLLVQGPLALAVLVSGEISTSPLSVLALLPSLLALIPLWFAWQRVKTRLATGVPGLQLKQRPFVPGQALEGELRLDRVLSPLTNINVHVLCQRQITRSSGDSRTTAKETIWEHTLTLSAAEARREISGVALPLRIDIPRGLPCTLVDEAATAAADTERHVWLMEISSAQGGKPATLPLPVFGTAQDAQAAETAAYDVEAIAPDTEQLETRLQKNGVHAEFDAAGVPVLIDCPPGRFRGMGIFLLIFGAFWFAAFVFMVKQGAPWPFRIIWGITAPLILGLGLWTLLHRRRVEIAADELRIVNSIGSFYSWHETYAPRHIVGFTHDTNMQAGNQFYYRVRAETTFGKTKTLIDGITESVTAETLAKRLEDWRKRG